MYEMKTNNLTKIFTKAKTSLILEIIKKIQNFMMKQTKR